MGSSDEGDLTCRDFLLIVIVFSRHSVVSAVTLILNRAQAGDPNAASELLPLVYEELRKLAAARMPELKP